MTAKKEINVEKRIIEDCNGNIKTLRKYFIGYNKTDVQHIKRSSGRSAEECVEIHEKLERLSVSLEKLLDNSERFFERIGIIFADEDVKIASEIKGGENAPGGGGGGSMAGR